MTALSQPFVGDLRKITEPVGRLITKLMTKRMCAFRLHRLAHISDGSVLSFGFMLKPLGQDTYAKHTFFP